MDELHLLKKFERVKAPPGFEQQVLAQLSLRRRKHLRMKHLRFSLAGAFSACLILFVMINFFLLPKKGPMEYADSERGASSAFEMREDLGEREIIPIIEAMDYAREIQALSRESQTVFILEQVSDTTSAEIKY